MQNWSDKILNIHSKTAFNELAISAFKFQYKHVPIYNQYCRFLNIDPDKITTVQKIPFLPIEFFKSKKIIAENKKAEHIFTSSGTTGVTTSQHLVSDIKIYEDSFIKAFELFYGAIDNYCILALLPSYLERGGSSLVYMANKLIELSKHKDSGFYLNNYEDLNCKLNALNNDKTPILLLGVTYALLDMAEQFPIQLQNTIIMETGGMKGKRKELIRENLHSILTESFGVSTIHSEYGMTELLSQGYSKGNGIFNTPPWMSIMIRDSYDPFSYIPNNQTGGINVIDLANINSCCFIETKDLGKVFNDESFTILGRFDNSDIRGCNLMAQ